MQSKKKLADVIDALNEVGDGSVLEKIENLLNDWFLPKSFVNNNESNQIFSRAEHARRLNRPDD